MSINNSKYDKLLLNEPLAQYTSWRVGGTAKEYFAPSSLESLQIFLKNNSKFLLEKKIIWLGLGSNVLIRDKGIDGLVIHTHKGLGNITIEESNKEYKIFRVEAGVTCAKFAKFVAKNSSVGAEFFAGIPGTMGGALAMNAGAFSGVTFNNVEKVEVIDNFGNIYTKKVTDFEIGYRKVVFKKGNEIKEENNKQEWFVSGFFKFYNGDADLATISIKKLLKERSNKQPIGELSCGSVFKNPEHNFAAKLIESSKLKGIRIGDAIVSNKHANFILNMGQATAKDIEELITYVKKVVKQKQGVDLELEVRCIGES